MIKIRKMYNRIGIILMIMFIVSLIFNVIYISILLMILSMMIFVAKLRYKIKNKVFQEKRYLIRQINLMKIHCKGNKVKDSLFKSHYENGCVYFNKKYCKNKDSLKRKNCMNNYIEVLKKINQNKKVRYYE